MAWEAEAEVEVVGRRQQRMSAAGALGRKRRRTWLDAGESMPDADETPARLGGARDAGAGGAGQAQSLIYLMDGPVRPMPSAADPLSPVDDPGPITGHTVTLDARPLAPARRQCPDMSISHHPALSRPRAEIHLIGVRPRDGTIARGARSDARTRLLMCGHLISNASGQIGRSSGTSARSHA